MSRKPALFFLLGFCLVAPSLHALAPHPCVLTVKYNDQMLPVVSVHKEDPVVLVDGKEKVIWAEPVFFLQQANGFGDDFIEVPGDALGGELETMGYGIRQPSGTGLPSTLEFKGTLISRKTLKGGFTVVVVYSAIDPFGDHSPSNRSNLIVHALPELPAGKSVLVEFSAGDVSHIRNPRFFTLFFDQTGREVLTNGVKYAWEYFALRDSRQMSQALGKYLEKFKGADHDAVPAIMPKPIFKPGAVPPQGEVTVVLTVEANGTVSAVDAGMIADDSIRDSLNEAMGGWLFLPKLSAGQPVSTYVKVPLKF